jgi:hypothetical protein
MALSTSQINFVYSGGPNNSIPSNSLGGAPSNFPIVGQINNLFSNISSVESTEGKIDYRCFYIINSSSSETLYDAFIFIFFQEKSGSSVQIGLAKTTEVQKIQISGQVSSGSLSLNYGGENFSCLWNGSATNFANNIIAGLEEIGVKGVEIQTSASDSLNVFNLNFKNQSNNRSHPLLSVHQNNLTSGTSVTIRKEVEGEPLNSIAPTLAVDTVSPVRVSFSDTSSTNKISIGNLKPGDKLPVWIKRTTTPGSDFLAKDNFILRITGSPFED